MTRDCRPLGREGERVPEFALPSSSCAGFCDSRVPTAHAREALHFVNGPAPSGTCVVSQKTPHHSQRVAHAQWAPGCHRSQRGKTVQRWSEEQGKALQERIAERPARYSDMVAAEIPDRLLYIRSIRRTDIFPPFF
ncbi:unnamed protein product, partial [Staurois parvus]